MKVETITVLHAETTEEAIILARLYRELYKKWVGLVWNLTCPAPKEEAR